MMQTPLADFTDFNRLQFVNALLPIFVMLLERVIFFRRTQSWKQELLITERLLESFTLVNRLQPENALSPNTFTEFGMETEVSLLQFKNAELSMVVR